MRICSPTGSQGRTEGDLTSQGQGREGFLQEAMSVQGPRDHEV